MSRPVTVLLIDDQPIVAAQLRQMLAGEPDLARRADAHHDRRVVLVLERRAAAHDDAPRLADDLRARGLWQSRRNAAPADELMAAE